MSVIADIQVRFETTCDCQAKKILESRFHEAVVELARLSFPEIERKMVAVHLREAE